MPTPVNCAICGATANVLGTRNGYQIYKCGGCKTYFTWPLPSLQENLSLYSKDYFSQATRGFGYADYDRDKQVMAPTFERYLDIIERSVPSKGTLVDVGAATGFFLKLAVDRGWSGIGIEPSEHASGLGRKKGLDVRTGIFDSNTLPPESVDVITLWDVIEHVQNPRELLRAVYATLRPGGLVAINTPDSGSMLARMLGSKWHLVVPPEHLFLFNKHSLQHALGPERFEILVQSKIGKGFTIQYLLKTLAHWQRFAIWRKGYDMVRTNAIGRLAVRLNLRDNMFLLARKL